jgi:HlyD family secretion protein
VKADIFEDIIPLTVQVNPISTFYIDTIEGGRIDDVHIEDGAFLNIGDPILSLSNSSLSLKVIESESEVSQLLNNISTLELRKNQDELASQREQIDINYNIEKLEQEYKRLISLEQQNHISQSELEDINVDLKYWRALKQYNERYLILNSKMQDSQLARLNAIYDVQQRNLSITRKNMEELKITAPAAGQITSFNVKKGQALGRGERIGQIDDNSNTKMVGFLDEFYLPRLVVGQSAQITISGKSVAYTVSKIFPSVNNGKFKIELLADDLNADQGIRRGQSFQGKLQLGASKSGLVLPNGMFMEQTLGNWIFVYNESTGQATRRNISIGNKNLYSIEILSGLTDGEKVITSDYVHFVDVEKLTVFE